MSAYPVVLVIFGFLGLFLAARRETDGVYALWAVALLGVNLWAGRANKLRKEIVRDEDRDSGEASSGHGDPDSNQAG